MPLNSECVISEAGRELLLVLTHRVRVLTLSQIRRSWEKGVSENRLEQLKSSGLLLSFTALIHPEISLPGPVAQWAKGEQSPDFGVASHRLRSRWKQAAIPVRCFAASRAAGRMFGGHGGRLPRESEETHDVHLAAVYLRLRASDPVAAKSWIHEEEIRKSRGGKSGGKLPDAILGETGKIIEFGGAYKKEKLKAFHEYCEARGHEYEVW